MEIKDILLKGNVWNEAMDKLEDIFKPRTHYDVFMLALAIGIMYDKRIEKLELDNSNDEMSVPRNVIANHDNGKLDFYFQAAVLTTQTEDFSEERRLELAFADHVEFNKIGFLVQFANYGVGKLVEHLGSTNIESMEGIKNFLISSVEGTNFEINGLPDELLLEE